MTLCEHKFYDGSMPIRKFWSGQRVRVNAHAHDLAPEYVGVYGHIHHLRSPATPVADEEYFVAVHNAKGTYILVRLPEKCIDDAPTEKRL